jgi:hypothetical protein
LCIVRKAPADRAAKALLTFYKKCRHSKVSELIVAENMQPAHSWSKIIENEPSEPHYLFWHFQIAVHNLVDLINSFLPQKTQTLLL